MRNTFVISVMLTAAVVALAAEFWDKKPFGEWTDKEVERILTDSPWAKNVPAKIQTPAGMGGPDMRGPGMGGSGTGGPGMGGPGMGGPGGGGPGMGGPGGGGPGMGGPGGPGMGGPSGMPQMTAMVRWQSALAVRRALARAKYGAEASAAEEAKKFLAETPSHYVLALENLPPMPPQVDAARMQEGLKTQSSLSRKGKEPLLPEEVRAEQTGSQSLRVLLLFPRTDPIVIEDKEVEFSTRVGPFELRRKFKLKEMTADGKLEL